jgi:hypothetical protein
MMPAHKITITVGEPNWAPLEHVLTLNDCMNYMYMGRAGDIELYKHRHTRRYLNISCAGDRFYRYSSGTYIEITQSAALEHVRS